MNSRLDPVALRWLIGGEIAQLRERGGLSLTAIAAATKIGKTKLGHMEIGRYNQDPEDIRAVLSACDTPPAEIDRLCSAATKPTGKPWWNRWRAVVPPWFGLYLGLEGLATSMFVYELSAVHGLLQTMEYAREITSKAVMVSDGDADRSVALRMARAERLRSEPRLKLHVVLDEATLHRRLDDPSIMKQQYRHLVDIASLSNVVVQVLPIERGLHAGVGMGNYAILDFAGLRSVAYAETYGGASFIRQSGQVEVHQLAARHCQETALSPAESVSLIEELSKRNASKRW